MHKWLSRTEIDWEQLCGMDPSLRVWNARQDVVEQVVLEAKYAGYIDRQSGKVERFQSMEHRAIPTHFDYSAVTQLHS